MITVYKLTSPKAPQIYVQEGRTAEAIKKYMAEAGTLVHIDEIEVIDHNTMLEQFNKQYEKKK